MNRFVGLSLMCLMFVSTQADSDENKSEFKGSSWSLYMSQDGDDPIQVQSERKEYDKNGVTLHRKSQGIIDRDGVYKPVDGKGVENPFKRRSFFGSDQKKEGKEFNREEVSQDQQGTKSNKGDSRLWKVLAYPFIKENKENSRDKVFQKKRFYGLHPKFADSKGNDIEEKLSKRSRVSFYRPVEKMFEKIFGSKGESEEKRGIRGKRPSFWNKSNRESKVRQPSFEHRENFEKKQRPPLWFKYDQSPKMQQPARLRPVRKATAERGHPRRWFDDDFERRQMAIWKRMREFEESFFGDFYEEE